MGHNWAGVPEPQGYQMLLAQACLVRRLIGLVFLDLGTKQVAQRIHLGRKPLPATDRSCVNRTAHLNDACGRYHAERLIMLQALL